MKIEIERIIGMEEIKDLYDRTKRELGEYMFTKDYVLNMLKSVRIEFFRVVMEKLEREDFDICFSIERSMFLRKEIKLTEKEKLWGYEVRKNLEREYAEQVVGELKKEGLNVWYIAGREWGLYFILKRW